MEYAFHILILIGIYTMAAAALDLVAGYSGLLSLSHACFYGVGAYVVALFGLKLGISFWLALPCAMLIAAVLAAIVAIPSLRTSGDFFVLATFGLQMIAVNLMTNLDQLTGGPLGLPGIPQPFVFGMSITALWQTLLLVLALAAMAFWVLRRLVRAPFGRALRAIREDEVLAEALGKPTLTLKVYAFAISAAVAAAAGGLYAVYITYIDPSSFTVQESIFMLSIVIIGGAGSLWGSVIGAVVLVALPELLRFIGLPPVMAAGLRQILYGSLLVLMMFLRPRGLVGHYGFSQ